MKKGDIAINSTFLFVLGVVMLFLLAVFYIYLKGKGISIIESNLNIPS